MVKEERILYILIIIMFLVITYKVMKSGEKYQKEYYNAGVEKGKLIKMEEFKGIYMPAGPN